MMSQIVHRIMTACKQRMITMLIKSQKKEFDYYTKLDHLVQQDQSDLLEIQKLQTEMLASLTKQLVSMQEEQARLMGQIEK